MVGIARSPVLVTAMRVSSRLMVVWGVLYVSSLPRRHAPATVGGVELGLGVPSLLLCWGVPSACAAPSTSLSSSALFPPSPGPLHLLHHPPPLGVSGALVRVQRFPPRQVGALSYAMPNPYNVAWDFPTVRILFFLGYVPVSPCSTPTCSSSVERALPGEEEASLSDRSSGQERCTDRERRERGVESGSCDENG